MSFERPMGILQRSADLVRLLADKGALSPAEIAERVDTPRPTVYRLGDALEQAHLTETVAGSKLKLSLRWLRLGDAARAAMSEWRLSHHRRVGCLDRSDRFLSVLRGQESVCTDWAQGQAINVLLLKPGRSLPLCAGAAGRVGLAVGFEDIDGYLAQAPFPPFTGRTLTSAAQLRQDIADTEAQGYVVSDEDVTEGIGALGAPLWTSRAGDFAGAL